MRNLLSIALCLPLGACVIGDVDSGGEDGDGDSNGSENPGADGSLTGLISADATWSGTVLIGYDKATTRIEPGVTVTVAPGTVIKFKSNIGVGLDIRGTLKLQGTKTDKIRLESATGDSSYGLVLGGSPTPGTLEMSYVVMTRGNIQTNAGSSATITDSKMFRAAGDLLIMSGGQVTMTYSQIGPDAGETDSTHCQIHTGGLASINITKSNINGAPFGMMFYGGQNAILTNNNWYSNMSDIDTVPEVSGDVTGSWFDEAPPTAKPGSTLLGLNNLAAARLTDAGVR